MAAVQAWVATDWDMTRSTKIIDYIGDDHERFAGTDPSYVTVIEFHREIQALADDAASSGDDEVDITDINPTTRSTDNIMVVHRLYGMVSLTLVTLMCSFSYFRIKQLSLMIGGI